MADTLDADEMKETFHRVAAYRAVCQAVRAGASHTFVSGLLFLFVTYLVYSVAGPHPFFYIFLGIALSELAVGVWKRVRPSAECVLLDGLLELSFGGAVLVRQYMAWQGMIAWPVSPMSLLIGAWSLVNAYQAFNNYRHLRRMFAERPTADHLAYVDDLVAEIRGADPEADPRALDLPTYPHLKAKLLGDLAVFVHGRTGAVTAAARDEVEIDREERGGGRLPTAYLRIDGEDYPEFGLSAANWRNYARWKTEGGDPPPPVAVRPVRERPTDD